MNLQFFNIIKNVKRKKKEKNILKLNYTISLFSLPSPCPQE
jgi:hypothetical protein